MSKRNFQRIFKRAIGMSPINYLIQVRLQKARKLLRESGYDMNDVAVMCGFSDSNYFIKCFKEAYHTTPLKFRQKFV
jgi:transcriptional regulator GlxA family with amidase domain